jgi:hypothetical protein
VIYQASPDDHCCPSTALVTIQPAFTDAERFALAGFLAGYRGLTREASALDLRQFSTWCRVRSLALLVVRRADIESFAREFEARGRARATVTRRLCTIAGFYREVRGRRGTPGSLPGRAPPPSAGGLRVACRRAGPQRVRRAPGRRRARPAARACADRPARAERPAGLRGHRRTWAWSAGWNSSVWRSRPADRVSVAHDRYFPVTHRDPRANANRYGVVRFDRCSSLGVSFCACHLPIRHLGNTTSVTPGSKSNIRQP